MNAYCVYANSGDGWVRRGQWATPLGAARHFVAITGSPIDPRDIADDLRSGCVLESPASRGRVTFVGCITSPANFVEREAVHS